MTGQAAPGRRLPGHSSNRIAPWPWAGQRRSPYVTRHPACCFESSSGWVVGAHSSRYARPSSCVPATHGPSNPDFHSCRPPPPRAALVWSRARVRDNSFTSGGRGPLHRRRSRVEGKQMHSTNSPALFPTTPMPLPTILPPRSHKRSYLRWTPRSTRYRSLRPPGRGTRA